MMIDIDLFKSINDRHGHDAGDAVLRQFAMLLRTVVRTQDCVVRHGGEEFVVYLPETDAAQALDVAERIRAAAAEQIIDWDDGPLRITVSIGVSCGEPPHKLQEELARADAALYRAKAEGRNAVRVSASPIPLARWQGSRPSKGSSTDPVGATAALRERA